MKILFEDPYSYQGAYPEKPLRLYYPQHVELTLECVSATGGQPVNIGALNLTKWELTISKSLATPAYVLSTSTYLENMFEGNTATFDFTTATEEMYRYASGGTAPAIFTLAGSNPGEPVPAVVIQFPIAVYSTPNNKQPSCLSTALMSELQLGAAMAGAAAERASIIYKDVLQAKSDAELAASTAALDAANAVSADLQQYTSMSQQAANTATQKATLAEESAANASQAASNASGSADSSFIYKEEAAQSKSLAQQSAYDAALSASDASSHASAASRSASDASSYATTAQGYASGARQSANTASGYASDALDAQRSAESARDAAQRAQQETEAAATRIVEEMAPLLQQYVDDARGYSESASGYADSAEGYKNDARQASSDASGYASNAQQHAADAQGYKSDAQQYATNAQQSAQTASGYVSTAQEYASDAQGYKADAQQASSDASGYAQQASGYRNDASGYATDAANAKADAISAKDLALGYRNDCSTLKDQTQAIYDSVRAVVATYTVGPAYGYGVTVDGTLISITWTDPADNDVVRWKRTRLIYKVGGFPENATDGTVLVDNYIRNQYKLDPFVYDMGVISDYYFALFTQSTGGEWNTSEDSPRFTTDALTWATIGMLSRAGTLLTYPGMQLGGVCPSACSTRFPGMRLRLVHIDYTGSYTNIGDYMYDNNRRHNSVWLPQYLPGEVVNGTASMIQFDYPEKSYARTWDETFMANRAYYTVSGETYTQLTAGTDYQNGDSVQDWETSHGDVLYNKNNNNRVSYGYNGGKESNMRGWLNATENDWFTPQNPFDTYPATAFWQQPFQSGMDAGLLGQIAPVYNKTARNTTSVASWGGGGGYDITLDKIWLPSIKEVFNSNNNNIAEGQHFQYFSEIATSAASRIQYDESGVARYTWLRSPYTGVVYNEYAISTSGGSNTTNANYSCAFLPALVI